MYSKSQQFLTEEVQLGRDFCMVSKNQTKPKQKSELAGQILMSYTIVSFYTIKNGPREGIKNISPELFRVLTLAFKLSELF